MRARDELKNYFSERMIKVLGYLKPFEKAVSVVDIKNNVKGVTDFDIEELYEYGTLYMLHSEEDEKGEIFIGLTSHGYYVYDLYMYN